DDSAAGSGDDGVEDAQTSEDGELQEQEARAVANLLRSRYSAGPKPWSRVAVLVPRHATIELLEDAFRNAGIPFVLEGGKSFYRREEVAAAVEALKAVDDPSDGVAVVAALKSLLFGLSDRVLLDAAEAGVRFGDPESVPDASPLFPAMQLLARLHRERHGRGVAATLSDLFASRQTFAAIENGAVVQPVQGLANLERLLAFARDLDREGLSFREAVSRLVRRTLEDAPEPGAFTEETDAVHLMTLHRAKGLEFDVVVLANLGLRETKPRRKAPVVCERAAGRFGVRLGFGAGMVGTARLHEVEEEEKARLDAEIRRLLYVGLTRASQKLVVSWFRRRRIKKDGDVSDGLDKSFLAPLAPLEAPSARLAALVEVVKPDMSKPVAAPPAPVPAAAIDLPAALREAEERLERVRKTAARPLRRAGEKGAAFVPAAEDAEPADRDEVPDRARRIGVAVHEAMERLLGTPAPRDGASKHSALDAAFVELPEDERAEAARLVEALLADPVTRRALSSKRRFVELPLLYRDASLPESPIVEGKIDLLFEEADGWQIVDWKTDRLAGAAARAEREALYAPQLRAYEEGLRKVLGPGARVKPGLLVFARLPEDAVGPDLGPT
ncbi:MAG TPA: 3'-5' exonuclease, partial [Thermoanaerobaculia bacterium]|nr:3'-5' exonuclease [Thermoanaerobaculia bacterium]